jgi:hypothetical protein
MEERIEGNDLIGGDLDIQERFVCFVHRASLSFQRQCGDVMTTTAPGDVEQGHCSSPHAAQATQAASNSIALFKDNRLFLQLPLHC